MTDPEDRHAARPARGLPGHRGAEKGRNPLGPRAPGVRRRAAASTGFKRVVRDLEFDVAELAIVTFLMARAYGKPLGFCPRWWSPGSSIRSSCTTPSAARWPRAICRPARRRALVLRDHAGWLRGILAEDYGVPARAVRWMTFEEAHVAEYRDPPNVERAPPRQGRSSHAARGRTRRCGGGRRADDPRIVPVIPDCRRRAGVAASAMARSRSTTWWWSRTRCPKPSARADEVSRLLSESRRAASRRRTRSR